MGSKGGPFRIIGSLLALLLLLLIAAGAALYFKDYAKYFEDQRGTLVRVTADNAGSDSVFEKSWVTLGSSSGFTAECGLLAPRGEKGQRFPAIVLMGGKATGKHAVDYALGISNVVIAAPDYPFTARDTYTVPQFIQDIPSIRQGLIDMVPAVMLTIDYLAGRPDVDTAQIVLLGYSFGAPFVPVIMAHDRRSAVAAMVYGGGDMRTLIGYNVARYEGPLLGTIAGLLSGWLLHPLEPLRYAARIAPVPAIMINGTDDEQIPRENIDKLYRELRQPKTIVWIDSRHVDPRNMELTRKIVASLKREIGKLGIPVE